MLNVDKCAPSAFPFGLLSCRNALVVRARFDGAAGLGHPADGRQEQAQAPVGRRVHDAQRDRAATYSGPH